MNLDYINPLTKENLGWVVASVLALGRYPRLSRALGKTAVYVGLTPFREGYAIGKIFFQELAKPKGQVRPIFTREAAKATARQAAPIAGRIIASPAAPLAIGGALAVAATTAGMVKQNPPPQVAYMRVPV